MNPTIMTARVSDQHLRLVNVPLIASGGVNVIQIRFEFCGLWTGCGKTAVFYRNPEEVYHVPIADGLATVPHEVLAEEGSFYIGVMGAASNIRTTEVVKVEVARGAITEATAEPEEPTPDIYEQLLAAYGQVEKELNLERARLNEVLATCSSSGVREYKNKFTGADITVKTSGATAEITASLDLVITGDSTHTLYCLPTWLAPLYTTELKIESGEADVSCVISANTNVEQMGDDAGVCLHFYNADLATFGPTTVIIQGAYHLASLSIPELHDLRVGFDGVTYPTAGEAIRGQFGVIESALDSIIAMQNELIGGGAE